MDRWNSGKSLAARGILSQVYYCPCISCIFKDHRGRGRELAANDKPPRTKLMPLPANVPQCRHTKTNGIRCGSPSVRGHYFCYYHAQIREHQRRHSCAEARELPLQLPPLEDAHSIQLALMEIGQTVLTDRISDKKAG